MQSKPVLTICIVILIVFAFFLWLPAQINNPGGAGSGACGSPTCTISTAGIGNGVLTLSGNTSGVATLTAPAVAGTVTNPISVSNSMLLTGIGSTFSPNGGTYAIGSVSRAGGLGNGEEFAAAPTCAGGTCCGGTAASIVLNNGTGAFKVNAGTAPTSACTIGMPTATSGYNCSVQDITTQSVSVFLQRQTGAESTTAVTFTNFNDTGTATAYTANDILKISCMAD